MDYQPLLTIRHQALATTTHHQSIACQLGSGAFCPTWGNRSSLLGSWFAWSGAGPAKRPQTLRVLGMDTVDTVDTVGQNMRK